MRNLNLALILLLSACNQGAGRSQEQSRSQALETPSGTSAEPQPGANAQKQPVAGEDRAPAGQDPAAGDPAVAKLMAGANAARGKSIYESRCANCHGASGKGNGPLAARLPAQPSNLTSAQIAGASNDRLFRAISAGGQAVGVSSAMPAFGNTLSQQQIADVIAYVRGLEGK